MLNSEVEILEHDTVLIAGGGPVGLILSVVLAKYGVKSIILERNESTTRWPKMDLTNVRSMELLRRLGLVDDIRRLGVPATASYRVLFISGLNASEPVVSWEFPCVEDLKAEIRANNDGSMPLEPWQRISQEVFERFLKGHCDDNALIDCRFGWKVEKSVESDGHVLIQAVHVKSGVRKSIRTKYLAACDGASSRARRDTGIELDGGAVPGYTLLVHFKSQDLDKLFKMGNFWHLFIFNEHGLSGAAISQDDQHIFTTHLILPVEFNDQNIESHDAVYRALGGMGAPFKIEIDEILVRSTYRHSIAVARKYQSPQGRIYLAGDSAHQNIPTGGYGMNMGIGDAFDLGWKLAATIKGKAGPALLQSYEEERRAVAMTCIQRSGVHMEAHMAVTNLLGPHPHAIEQDTEEGRKIRQGIREHYESKNGENTDIGVEMDHRHKSCVYPQADGIDEDHTWSADRYTPSTSPGSRAPHVYLKDGNAIFDHFGDYWTLFEFVNDATEVTQSSVILDEAAQIGMPIKHVVLCGEDNAAKIWQTPLVLVRPDGHVAWRGETVPSSDTLKDTLATIAGWKQQGSNVNGGNTPAALQLPFAATTEVTSQVKEYNLERMGAMQS